MNRFNLTFSGEIQSGHQPDEVKARFRKMFEIEDPASLERFFSGKKITLKSDLERKEAAEYFQDIQRIGAVAMLEKIEPEGDKPQRAGLDRERIERRRQQLEAERLQREQAELLKQEAAQQAQQQAELERQEAERERQQRKQAIAAQAAKEAAQRQREEARRQQLEAEQARKEAERERKQAERRRAQAEKERKKAERASAREARAKEKAELAQQKTAERNARKARKEEARKKAAAEEAQRKAQRAEDQRLAKEKAAQEKAELEKQQRLAREKAAQEKAKREKQQSFAQEKAVRGKAAQEKTSRQNATRQKQKRLVHDKAAQQKASGNPQKASARRSKEQALAAADIQATKGVKSGAGKGAAHITKKTTGRSKAATDTPVSAPETRRQQRDNTTADQPTARQASKGLTASTAKEKSPRATAPTARGTTGNSAEEMVRDLVYAQVKRQEAAALDAVAKPQQATADTGIEPARIARPAKTEPPKSTPAKSRLGPIKSHNGTGPRRKRQAGEPNLYSLTPFRVSTDLRQRVPKAQRAVRSGVLLMAVAVLGVVMLMGLATQLPQPTTLPGAQAVTADEHGKLYLLSGQKLLRHDRAGVALDAVELPSLGVRNLQAPLIFSSSDSFLALGQLATEDAVDEPAASELIICDLETPRCRLFSPALAGRDLVTFARNSVDGSVFAIERQTQALLRLDSDGQLLESASLTLPEQPSLSLDSGLLLMNSSTGPGVGVYRYDRNALGTQLDEALLLPATGEIEYNRVGQFLHNGHDWWVVMTRKDSGAPALFRFDNDWGYLGPVDLPHTGRPFTLARWGEKVLVHSDTQVPMARFNRRGQPEAPFTSTLLEEQVETANKHALWASLGWRSALFLLLGLAVFAGWRMYLNHLRTLVYKSRRVQGAEPVDGYADKVTWVDPLPARQGGIRLRWIGLTILAGATCLWAIMTGASVFVLSALLLLVAGLAAPLVILARQSSGHIGILGQKLLLVDHTTTYHFAGGSNIEYRGNFLMIDDVVVFLGNTLWPTFCQKDVREKVLPLTRGGVRVDRRTLITRLIERRHPIVNALFLTLAFGGAALAVLLLPTLP